LTFPTVPAPPQQRGNAAPVGAGRSAALRRAAARTRLPPGGPGNRCRDAPQPWFGWPRRGEDPHI